MHTENRRLAACALGALVAMGLIGIASRASAQPLVASDLIGDPLGLVETPVLTPGACYEIQTVGLLPAAADPIISIRTGTSDLDSTIAGADACDSPGGSGLLKPACSRFCVSAATFPSPRSFTVWIRAFVAPTRGTTILRIQQVVNNSVIPSPTLCPFLFGVPPPPVSSGCWTSMTRNPTTGADVPVSFGGLISNITRPTGWFQMETAELPGIQAGAGLTSTHIIVFAGDNNDPALNWRISASAHPTLLGSGGPASHRNKILQTAQYTGQLPPFVPTSAQIATIAAPYLGTGPFRLIRNDYVYDTAPRAGTDGDGDKLGPGLEELLKTCDTAATSTQGGLACATLPTCTAAMTTPATMNTSCKQSMRDSDQDGLRDDIEFYGVQLFSSGGGSLDGGYLARYGANPAHYDVFVEVDYSGTASAAGGCTGSARGPTAAISRAEAIAMASQYAAATNTAFRNRDGIGGIALHLDIGGLAAVPPLPTDTSGGNWGGSTCYRDRPLCVNDADCAGATPVAGSCCLTASCYDFVNDGPPPLTPPFGQCLSYDPRLEWMSSARRWLFFSASMYQDNLGGGTRVFAMQSYGGGPNGVTHELGHQGGLEHGGPHGSGMGALANGTPNHPSIMNYAFSYVGGARLTPPYGGGGADTATRVTFSSGVLPSLNPLALPEFQPLGPAGDYELIGRAVSAFIATPSPLNPARVRVVTTPGSQSIDFNEDDQVAVSGQTVEGRVAGGIERLGRQVILPVKFLSEGGPEIVQVGPGPGTIFRIRVAGQVNAGVITPGLEHSSSTTFSCSETPVPGFFDRFPACEFVGPATTAMSTPGEIPVAVAADSAQVGSAPQAVVVWRTAAGGHSSGVLSAAGTWATRGPITTPTLPALASGSGFPSLARIGGAQTVLLTYRNASGDVMEQVGTSTATATTWSAATPVVLGTAETIVGSPATTTLESNFGLTGVLMVTGKMQSGAFSWVIRRRWTTGPTTGGWAVMAVVPEPTGGTWGRPAIEIRPFRTGTTAGGAAILADRLIVSWRSVAFGLDNFTRMSPRNALVGSLGNEWTAANPFAELATPTVHAAEMQLDTRLPRVGLRGSWSGAVQCNPADPAACPVGATCSLFAGGSSAAFACVLNAPFGLVQAEERLTPTADGVQAITIPDFNEWSTMRHGYCTALRQEGSTVTIPSYPGFGGPFLHRGWAPSAYNETSASCAPKPVYAR